MALRTSLVVLQPSSLCNLNCTYCYVPNRRDGSRMDRDTLEIAIAKVLQSPLVQDEVEFLWHAGEPLAVGLSYYKDAVQLLEKYNARGLKITKSIQTNGTLISPDWCQFFVKHDFSLGLSIDGPAFLHDRSRKNWSGRGSHQDVMRGFGCLRKYGITPGAICVLSRESLGYPSEILHFFLDHGFRSLAFNVEEVENTHSQSSLTRSSHNDLTIVREYHHFISQFYDLWLPYQGKIRIREFDEMVGLFREKLVRDDYMRTPLETIEMGIITIHKNGDLSTFSPEFAGGKSREYADFVVGNIRDDTLEDIRQKPVFQKIRNDVFEGIANCARTCCYFDVCGGGYVSNKYFENTSLKSTETTACLLHRQELAVVLIEKLTS